MSFLVRMGYLMGLTVLGANVYANFYEQVAKQTKGQGVIEVLIKNQANVKKSFTITIQTFSTSESKSNNDSSGFMPNATTQDIEVRAGNQARVTVMKPLMATWPQYTTQDKRPSLKDKTIEVSVLARGESGATAYQTLNCEYVGDTLFIGTQNSISFNYPFDTE